MLKFIEKIIAFNQVVVIEWKYLPDIGTRSLTVSAFRIRYSDNATT